MTWLPTCVCRHNLIDHADCWDQGQEEGCCLKEGCPCVLFHWDGEGGEGMLSPYIVLSNAKALLYESD